MTTVSTMRGFRAHEPGKAGFILIAVLWVAMLLAVFALNYATSSRLGLIRVQTAEQLFVDAHILRSALEWGEHEIRKYYANRRQLALSDTNGPKSNEDIEETNQILRHPRYEPYELELAGRLVLVRMVSEAGKWNVNRISPALLEEVLRACGVPAGAEATGIVNSILDWIDEDDLRRAEGAESDYYMALASPYYAKNQPIESIEELLLIKGVGPKLYFGDGEHPGLVDFLDVSGQTEKLDINSASLLTLSLLPDITEETRLRISQLREDAPLTSLVDLAPDLDLGAMERMDRYFGVGDSNVVLIEARIVNPETGLTGRPMYRKAKLEQQR